MEQCRPLVQTVVDMPRYARALIRAWRALFDAEPTKEAAGVLWAQYGIETGAGPWCWGNNLGNIKHVAGDGHDYFMLPNTWEMAGGKKQVFQPPDPATWFRAYGSLDEGMTDYLSLLHGKRYASAWPAVEAGDCGWFARLLKRAEYFTADATAYANGMRPHFKRWMQSSAFDDALESERALSRPTEPTLIVHPDVPLDGGSSNQEPPDDAA